MTQGQRAAHLIWIAIAGMGFLGAVYILMECILNRDVLTGIILGVPIGLCIGCFVGIPSAPFVVLCLMKKRLVHSLLLVYGSGLIAVVWHAYVFQLYVPEPSAAVLALLGVIVMSIIAFIVLPNAPEPRTGRCVKCDYDLRATTTGVCPECGTRLDFSSR